MKERNIDEYLMEIGREPLLSVDEERALLKTVQEKGLDCEEMKRLEKSFARFVPTYGPRIAAMKQKVTERYNIISKQYGHSNQQ